MKIVLSDNVINEKIPLLKSLGWDITTSKIEKTIQNPNWRGTTKYHQPTVMSLIDKGHILRVVFKYQEDDIIFVITIHIARRGTYESTKSS